MSKAPVQTPYNSPYHQAFRDICGETPEENNTGFKRFNDAYQTFRNRDIPYSQAKMDVKWSPERPSSSTQPGFGTAKYQGQAREFKDWLNLQDGNGNKNNCPPPSSPAPISAPAPTPTPVPMPRKGPILFFQSIAHTLSSLGRAAYDLDQRVGQSSFGQGVQEVNLAMYQGVNNLLNFVNAHGEAILYAGAAGVVLAAGARNGNLNTAQSSQMLSRAGQALSRVYIGR